MIFVIIMSELGEVCETRGMTLDGVSESTSFADIA